MTKLLHNISLKPYNTFGIDIKAKYLIFYNQPTDIQYLINKGLLHNHKKIIILGGGSNYLFLNDFDGVIIHPVNDTIEIIKENSDFIWIKAGAGLEWDNLVAYAVKNGYGGIENLSNIPGSVGAAPVQNIGAYGVEAKNCIDTVHLVNLNDGTEKTIKNTECEFGYRTSIFKTKLKNQFLVDSVTFKLFKKPKYIVHYGSVKEQLDKLGKTNLKTIRETVINIRDSKLPNPKQIGNGGSFFKNPVITETETNKLLIKHPAMPVYDNIDEMKKLAAGWLIEQCGLKGYSNPNNTAGIHNNQALVIINKGNATGTDIYEIAQMVKNKVFKKFSISLEPEVIIV